MEKQTAPPPLLEERLLHAFRQLSECQQLQVFGYLHQLTAANPRPVYRPRLALVKKVASR